MNILLLIAAVHSLNITYWTLVTPTSNLTFQYQSPKLSVLQHTKTSYDIKELHIGSNTFKDFEGTRLLDIVVVSQNHQHELYLDIDNLYIVQRITTKHAVQINPPIIITGREFNYLKYRYNYRRTVRVGVAMAGLVLAGALLAYLLVISDEEFGDYELEYCEVQPVEEKDEDLPPYELEYKLAM